jgi:hypothetical protein
VSPQPPPRTNEEPSWSIFTCRNLISFQLQLTYGSCRTDQRQLGRTRTLGSSNDIHTVLRRLQWNSPVVVMNGWHLHRHRRGPQFLINTTNTRWGLLSGHQWGPPPGHQWGLFHGHGHREPGSREGKPVLVQQTRGPVGYATWGWWVVVHCRANSAGVSPPWALWGVLAL